MKKLLSENKAIVKDFLSQLDKTVTAIDDFFSPGCQAYLPGNPLPTDREGFKGFVGMLYRAFPDLRHEIVQQIAEGDRVATIVTAHGTHRREFQGIPATGRQVVITDIIVARIEEGKIAGLWAQFDSLGLLSQLGGRVKPAAWRKRGQATLLEGKIRLML